MKGVIYMKKNVVDYGAIKFSKCCDDWLHYKHSFVKESSFRNYKFIVEKHIKSILGNKNLLEIACYDMSEFVKIKKQEAHSSSLKGMLIILKSILKYTKKKYGIDFDFDFQTGYIKNIDCYGVEIFNERERERLYKYLSASNDIKDLGIFISLYSGLRIGEVCGLKWRDVDLENRIIYVKRTVQRIYIDKRFESQVVITTPKTRRSARQIPISRALVEKLAKNESNYDPESYITTGSCYKTSEPLTYRYTYKQVLRKCNIPYKKFHCLRHTFATRCIRVGMDVKSLSEVLGHSNIATTMNIYVHSSYEVKKKYLDKL